MPWIFPLRWDRKLKLLVLLVDDHCLQHLTHFYLVEFEIENCPTKTFHAVSRFYVSVVSELLTLRPRMTSNFQLHWYRLLQCLDACLLRFDWKKSLHFCRLERVTATVLRPCDIKSIPWEHFKNHIPHGILSNHLRLWWSECRRCFLRDLILFLAICWSP